MSFKNLCSVMAMFAASAGASFAQDAKVERQFYSTRIIPKTIITDPTTHSDLVVVQSSKAPDGTEYHLEALRDYDLDLMCEWEMKTRGDTASIMFIHCAQEQDSPPMWMFSYMASQSIARYMTAVAHNPWQDPALLTTIVERAGARNDKGFGIITTKVWDFKKREVCVDIQKGFETAALLNIKLGCFPFPNTRHADDLLDFFKIKMA